MPKKKTEAPACAPSYKRYPFGRGIANERALYVHSVSCTCGWAHPDKMLKPQARAMWEAHARGEADTSLQHDFSGVQIPDLPPDFHDRS